MPTERAFRAPRPETPRDMEETAFTPLLRRYTMSLGEVQAVVFVDDEGETVDYTTRIPIYDAKVIGAQLHVLTHAIVQEAKGGGVTHAFHLVADKREFLVRRVSNDYTLVIVSDPPAPLGALAALTEETVRLLRAEGGIAMPLWEPQREVLRVEIRASTGWGYAPTGFVEHGVRHAPLSVVGRWIDHEDQGSVCFLVRASTGEETVLVHRPREGRWYRRVDEAARP